MSRQKNSKCIWWKRFRAVLHHLHWSALPQCKQSQNSSQTLTDPESSPGKKKATLDQSQPTERETDIAMQCLNQDHTASSSRERIKVLHANPTPSLQLMLIREKAKTVEITERQNNSPEEEKTGKYLGWNRGRSRRETTEQ